MARKPNYSFERQERERAAALKAAEKAERKAEAAAEKSPSSEDWHFAAKSAWLFVV